MFCTGGAACQDALLSRGSWSREVLIHASSCDFARARTHAHTHKHTFARAHTRMHTRVRTHAHTTTHT